MRTKTTKRTLFLAQFSILLAIEAIFCFTPLGSLPIGPMVATLGMLPVIITAVMLGTAAGTAMGFLAGLFSFLVWTFTPPVPPLAFIYTPAYPPGNFWSLVICFVPRALVGTVCGLLFNAMKNLPERLDWLRYGLPGFAASMVNTVGVLGLTWLFFGDAYSAIAGLEMALGIFIGYTIITNGVLEAVISALTSFFVCLPLRNALAKMK